MWSVQFVLRCPQLFFWLVYAQLIFVTTAANSVRVIYYFHRAKFIQSLSHAKIHLPQRQRHYVRHPEHANHKTNYVNIDFAVLSIGNFGRKSMHVAYFLEA